MSEYLCTTITDTIGVSNTFTPQHFMLCIFITVVICGAVILIMEYKIDIEQQRVEEENKNMRNEIIWK